ncbi:MAG: hypothetical protein ACPLTP_01505 [Thermotoga caldifontis]|uniref:hypothetical protein n=1 Tax=Thermotoga caldifontis TaxID=1508419 RepID=UPI003C7B2442
MTALQNLRWILRTISESVEVLPAVGGAEEDLVHPDFEEREDQIFDKDDLIFDTIFERDSLRRMPSLYRPVPSIGRIEKHFFRYFLDGSFRSYFLGTLLENERDTPVHFAQVGACTLRREDDGTMRREVLQMENVLLVAKGRLSEVLWTRLEKLASETGIKLVDITEKDTISETLPDFDLRNKAAGKVRYVMHSLESEVIKEVLPKLSEDSWLIVDGSLLFNPTLDLLSKDGRIKPVIGVAKNFRKDPQFVFGRGPRAERYSIYKLLADLRTEHRTAAFSARDGRVVFWYVRLREQKHLDYPLMGVVKVELVNPSKEPVPTELIDLISRTLVAERSVTPHGQDRRWHVHLYPIFLAECTVKENFLSREVVHHFLKWR